MQEFVPYAAANVLRTEWKLKIPYVERNYWMIDDIADIVKERGNILEVKMHSTIAAMENMDCKHYFGVFNTPRVLLRKKQCDFGWDWAANIPGYGIWKDVVVSSEAKECITEVRYIAGADKKAIFIAELNYCYRSHYDNEGNFVEMINPHKDELRFSLAKTPGGKLEEVETKVLAVQGRKHFVTFHNSEAKLWWPNGYGEQPLLFLPYPEVNTPSAPKYTSIAPS